MFLYGNVKFAHLYFNFADGICFMVSYYCYIFIFVADGNLQWEYVIVFARDQRLPVNCTCCYGRIKCTK